MKNLDKQQEESIEAVIEGLITNRLRHLNDSEVEEIVRDLNDEFLISGALMTGLSKTKKRKRRDWRKDFR